MRPHNDVFQQFTDACFQQKTKVDKKPNKEEALEACRRRRRIEAHEMAKSMGLTLDDLGMSDAYL